MHAIYARLVAVLTPADRLTDLGILGLSAIHLGDLPGARRADSLLAATTDPYDFGGTAYGRARIAAHLGARERAVELLSAARAKGINSVRSGNLFETDLWLEPLRGYAPFEALLKPRG